MSYWERMSTSTRRPCSPEKAADSWLRWHPLRAQSSTSPSPPTAIRASVDIPALRFNVHLPPLLTLVQDLTAFAIAASFAISLARITSSFPRILLNFVNWQTPHEPPLLSGPQE